MCKECGEMIGDTVYGGEWARGDYCSQSCADTADAKDKARLKAYLDSKKKDNK